MSKTVTKLRLRFLPTESKIAKQPKMFVLFVSEGMEFEPRWVLLFHQPAAADRRGDHPLYGAGTTGHRICTAAGNDCVIRPQEHTQPCTDTLRHTQRWSSIHPVISNAVSLRVMTSFIARVVDLLPVPQKSISIYFSCIFTPIYRSSCLAVCGHFKRRGTKLKVSWVTSLFMPYIQLLLKTVKGLNVTFNYIIQHAICPTLKLSCSWVIPSQ